MMASVSGRDRRALLVGTAAMALIAGARPLASSGTRWAVNTREERAALEGKLATEEASVRRAGTARDSLVARRVRLAALDTMLFKAATPGLAAAMLAERLTDAAQSSKAQMSNLQLRSDSTRVQALVPVQVQASVMGDWPAVARFLAQLESGSKLLAVRELTMTSLAAPGGVAGQRPGVRADLVVEGLARIEPQPVARR
jgi:hypothetical protein